MACNLATEHTRKAVMSTLTAAHPDYLHRSLSLAFLGCPDCTMPIIPPGPISSDPDSIRTKFPITKKSRNGLTSTLVLGNGSWIKAFLCSAAVNISRENHNGDRLAWSFDSAMCRLSVPRRWVEWRHKTPYADGPDNDTGCGGH